MSRTADARKSGGNKQQPFDAVDTLRRRATLDEVRAMMGGIDHDSVRPALKALVGARVRAESQSAMSTALTAVTVVFIPRRINVYLRFGKPLAWHEIDRRRRIGLFTPGATFCRVCRRSNAYGTTHWQLSILQTQPPCQGVQKVAGIEPDAALLLHVHGECTVQRVLDVMTAIESERIELTDVASSYWRTLHNRLAGGGRVTPYTAARHAAQLRWRALA